MKKPLVLATVAALAVFVFGCIVRGILGSTVGLLTLVSIYQRSPESLV